MATQTVAQVTEEEYLAFERASDSKHEFVGGEVSAMSEGTLRHSRLALNWGAQLLLKLRDTDCGVFNSDARVRTSTSGSYVYPDISVACGETALHRDEDDILADPKVIIEILSPSTADYDRGRKFELYREISSLEEYILVHTDSVHVEHFERQPDASWICREYRGLDDVVVIASLNCTVSLCDAYAGINFG